MSCLVRSMPRCGLIATAHPPARRTPNSSPTETGRERSRMPTGVPSTGIWSPTAPTVVARSPQVLQRPSNSRAGADGSSERMAPIR